MVHIYSANGEHIRKNHPLKSLLSSLPEDIQKRAIRYKSQEAAYNFVVGRLLLKYAIEQMDIPFKYEDIQVSENEKPFYKGASFNLSHSGDLVACAIAKRGNLGLDVEEIKAIDWKSFEAWFTAKEWDVIVNAENSLVKFYQYWCRKESIIKALGLNLSYLNKIEVDVEEEEILIEKKQLVLKELDFGKTYVGVLSADFEITDLKLMNVHF